MAQRSRKQQFGLMEGTIARWIGKREKATSSGKTSDRSMHVYPSGFRIVEGATGRKLEVVAPGDCVILKSGLDQLPFVALITRTFEHRGMMMIECRWFYRPNDTSLPVKRKRSLAANELLISDSKDVNVINSIIAKTSVGADACNGNTSEGPFFCRFKYDAAKNRAIATDEFRGKGESGKPPKQQKQAAAKTTTAKKNKKTTTKKKPKTTTATAAAKQVKKKRKKKTPDPTTSNPPKKKRKAAAPAPEPSPPPPAGAASAEAPPPPADDSDASNFSESDSDSDSSEPETVDRFQPRIGDDYQITALPPCRSRSSSSSAREPPDRKSVV